LFSRPFAGIPALSKSQQRRLHFVFYSRRCIHNEARRLRKALRLARSQGTPRAAFLKTLLPEERFVLENLSGLRWTPADKLEIIEELGLACSMDNLDYLWENWLRWSRHFGYKRAGPVRPDRGGAANTADGAATPAAEPTVDYYKVLGVSTTASRAAVRKA